MIKEVISSILQAESEAESIVLNAQIDARKMIENASETAKQMRQNASEQMKQERKAELNKATEIAQTKYDNDIAKAKIDAETLKKEGETRAATAVEFIVRRVIS